MHLVTGDIREDKDNMDALLQISVVICSYNRADYIADAMGSLYHQTLPHTAKGIFTITKKSSRGPLLHATPVRLLPKHLCCVLWMMMPLPIKITWNAL